MRSFCCDATSRAWWVTSHQRRASLLLLSAFCATGCVPRLDVRQDASISCREASQCPDNWVCVTDIETCRPRGVACIEQTGATWHTVQDGNECTTAAGARGICQGGSCQKSSCGDGVLDAGEECDDGNQVNEDACLTTCLWNTCGDGYFDPGSEECDDGNDNFLDSCLPGCVRNVCGDGVLNLAAESCEETLGTAAASNPNDGCNQCLLTTWVPELVTGSGRSQGDPKRFSFGGPFDVAVDQAGNVFVADSWTKVVWRIDSTGLVTRYAGTGTDTGAAPGNLATTVSLAAPVGLALDNAGNLYIAETSPTNPRISRVDARTGILNVVVGNGTKADPTVGPVADSAVNAPFDLVVDAAGNLYFTDTDANGVFRVTSGFLFKEQSASAPSGIAIEPDGGVLFASGNRIWKVNIFGLQDILYGTGTVCTEATLPCGDGGPAAGALLANPFRLVSTADGDLYTVDASLSGGGVARIRRIDPQGTISSVAGAGPICSDPALGCGDGGPGLDAELYVPIGLAVAANGDLVFSELSGRVRWVHDPTGAPQVELLGGLPRGVVPDGAANQARLSAQVKDTAVAPNGDLYFDGENDGVIYRVDANGMLAWVAGSELYLGAPPSCTSGTDACGDGGPGVGAFFNKIDGLAFFANGDLLIDDAGHRRLRRLRLLDGIIEPFAATGAQCASTTDICGDGNPATAATFYTPRSLAIDSADNVYVADHARVRRIDAVSGIITTVTGTGTQGTAAGELWDPQYLAVGPTDELYIADETTSGTRVVRATKDGSVSVVVPKGAVPSFTSASGLGVLADGKLLLADAAVRELFAVDISGRSLTSSTYLGTGAACPDNAVGCDDGVQAQLARITLPGTLAVDAQGSTYVSDCLGTPCSTAMIRKVDATSNVLTTVVGPLEALGAGPLASGALINPQAIVGIADQKWVVADGVSGNLRLLDEAAQVSTIVLGHASGADVGTGDAPIPARYSRLLVDAAGVALDATGSVPVLYVTEAGFHDIRRVWLVDVQDPSTWTTDWLTGADVGVPGSQGGDLASARFDTPTALAFDAAAHVLYVADTGNHVVRAVDLVNQQVSLAVGVVGVGGFDVDAGAGIAPLAAVLNAPEGLLLDGRGNLYIADTGNHRLRYFDRQADRVFDVGGSGLPGALVDYAEARYAFFDSPRGMALDPFGNLFVAGRLGISVLLADSSGNVSRESPVRVIYGAEPRSFPADVTRCISNIQLLPGSDDSLLALDACVGFVVRLQRQPLPL